MAKRWGILTDLKRCVGCHACSVACKQEWNVKLGYYWTHIETVGPIGTFPDLKMYWIPLFCQGCKNPPCKTVCPTGATSQREDGIIAIDEDKCINCHYCIWACPYGARTFNPADKIIEKCNWCFSLIDAGKEPPCVTCCPAKARWFGDLNDPDSEIAKLVRAKHARTLLPQLDTDPSVLFVEP